MAAKKRIRTIGSVSKELLKKSREAALAAVQVFNNPAITFKAEIYVVLMVISWTYLLHANYRKHGIEYRYYRMVGKRKRFDHTANGAEKYWELERCLNDKASPVDKNAANNLRFLIELRHEIEHQMTKRLDEFLSARFQACCLNYNDHIKNLFGDEHGIDKHLAFSLQFSSITRDHVNLLDQTVGLPGHILAFITGFDAKLTADEFNDPRFAYRILFVPKTANRKGQADQVIEFVKADSELAKGINAQYAVIKETERPKYLPKQVVAAMQAAGYPRFSMHHHTQFWKQVDAKNPAKGLGTLVVKTWYWYEPWIEQVSAHCADNAAQYQ
ncbi:DUF3644 domain-containing protein [Paraburkholderia aromaticivorans]|uniref:DUF3644 domain-containing protein n=1 Tax=Paraburkholderia aromaticivorans TaxID=2026199 RepID=A0A248VPH0_9BURK|nr:DUF3644 domain-containing protein [Paraburkholderia aromaticivorans]ASW00402.1 hypothetical protein CJU94_13020 [Paraburkholderia aromaticivorans]